MWDVGGRRQEASTNCPAAPGFSMTIVSLDSCLMFFLSLDIRIPAALDEAVVWLGSACNRSTTLMLLN